MRPDGAQPPDLGCIINTCCHSRSLPKDLPLSSTAHGLNLSLQRGACAGALLLLFVYSLETLSCLAAEDPARFLSATSWQGTLTRSASDAGSGQYVDGSGFLCDQRWNLTHSSSLDITT